MTKVLKLQEKKVQAVYFSPTGTTRRVLSTIVKNVGLKATPPIDLTLPGQRNSFTGKVEGDLILVGSPVYAGTIPPPLFESLQKIRGEGKWAVPVAVYGNRSPDTAVEELTKILRSRGFKVLAAASFIGEHTLATPEHPWGIGRPDETDLRIAAEFGKALGEKFQHRPTEIIMPELLLEQLSDTMVDELPEGYHSKVIAGVRTMVSISLDKAGCTQCNSCVDLCPVAAIDAESFAIDDSKCIRCLACVRNCPTGTMRFALSEAPPFRESIANANKTMTIRKEPKTIL